MGRMLDSLNQMNGQNGSAKEPKGPAAATAPPAVVAPPVPTPLPETSDEEFHYVEVGAPGKKIEGSPSVLAAGPPVAHALGSPAPVAQPPAAKVQSHPALVPTLSEPRPLTASFEAWPTAKKAPAIARDVITFHQPDHPVAKQYRELFSKVLGELEAVGGRIVVCAGAAPQVGTTTVLVNMAFSEASPTKQRRILVEANWQRPGLAHRLGLVHPPGLQDVLAGTTALEQAVIPTVRPQLFALTAASAAGGKPIPADALSWVLTWLRDRFDVILVDAPDLGDTEALKPLVAAGDMVYLVLPQDSAPAQVNSWTQALSRLGGRVRGLIHTHFENG